MSALTKRILLWSAIGTVVLAGLAMAFRPRPLAVDIRRVDAGALTDAEAIVDEMVYVDQIVKAGDVLAHLLAPERFPRLTGRMSA